MVNDTQNQPKDTAVTDSLPQTVQAQAPQDATTNPATLNAHLDELAREVLELKLAALNETSAAEASVKRLQGRLWWLRVSLVLTFIAFGGVISWQAIGLRQQQLQIIQMQATLSDLEAMQPDQVRELSNQLLDLQEQVADDLPGTLEQNQEAIATLQTDVETLRSTIGDRQQALIVLIEALQSLVIDEPEATDEAEADDTEEENLEAEENPDETPEPDEQLAPATEADEPTSEAE